MESKYLYRIEGNYTVGFKANVFKDMSADHVEKFTVISQVNKTPITAPTLVGLMSAIVDLGYGEVFT